MHRKVVSYMIKDLLVLKINLLIISGFLYIN